MSRDPNSNYGGNPYENPQGSPNPYGAPQDPQNPYGTPPQGSHPPYGTPQPQDPYSGPPQTPYGVPPQGAYAQGSYGAPGYGAGAGAVPSFNPLPLNVAVQQLFQQYVRVTTKPSANTFAAELPKAGWDITWIQILIYTVIGVILRLISALIASTTVRNTLASSPYSQMFSSITAATSVGSALLYIIFIPVAVFIVVGVQYLLAKAFGGQGTFLGQCYTYLLFTVPLTILSSIVTVLFSLIPFIGSFFGGLIAFAIFIYSIVLNVFQVQAAHRLSGGKATWVVLIPVLALVVLGGLCVAIFAAVIISAMHGLSH
jgi:hypothetical protein